MIIEQWFLNGVGEGCKEGVTLVTTPLKQSVIEAIQATQRNDKPIFGLVIRYYKLDLCLK